MDNERMVVTAESKDTDPTTIDADTCIVRGCSNRTASVGTTPLLLAAVRHCILQLIASKSTV